MAERGRSPTRTVVDATLLMAFVALVALPWDQWLGGRVDLGASLGAPSLTHPLGTDNLGRDLLVRIASAMSGGVLPLWLGVAIGSLAGFALAIVMILTAEARRARAIVWGVDLGAALLASIPVGLLAFTWAVLAERAGLFPVMMSLSALFAVRTYLEARDLFRHDARLAYWTAHAALGGTLLTRLWRYGMRAGWRAPLARSLGFHLRAAIAIEASLSYLGFGIQEPQASFGNMLASHLDLYLNGRFEVLILLVLMLFMTAAVPDALVNLLSRRGKRQGSNEGTSMRPYL